MLFFQNGMEAGLNNWINYTQTVFDARNVAVDIDVANIIVRVRKNLKISMKLNKWYLKNIC